MKDAGNYTLTVTSSVFHENSIQFQIVVESNEVDPTVPCDTNLLPIVALVVLVVILVPTIVILTVVVVCRRKNNAASKNTT